MTALRAIVRWTLQGALLALLAGLGLATLAELVERGGRPDAAVGLVVALRVALLARELLPVLLGVGLIGALAWRRQTGELVALAAAGVRPGTVLLGACLGGGIPGLILGFPLEIGAGTLRDRLTEEETGGAQVAGRWVLTPEAAVYVGAAEGAVLREVTVVPRGPGSAPVRYELDTLEPDGAGWRMTGLRTVALAPHQEPPAGAPPLPDPAWLTQTGPSAPAARQSAAELASAGFTGWALLRATDPFLGLLVGFVGGVLGLRLRAGPAGAVALAALALGLWRGLSLQLGALWPLGLVLAVGLAFLPRAPRWEAQP